MRIKNTNAYSAIKLADSGQVPKEVQVLRVGKFNHPRYGIFEITSQVLAEMKANFDAKVRGIDTAFDYFHESDKEAAAWVNALELRENNQELWAAVEWTPKAAQKLAERELRYFSPDFAFKWQDPESGNTFSNVLFGGGLTNRPFVKEMKAIIADEFKGETMTELEKAQAKVKELEAANVKLSEDKAMLEKKMEEMPKPEGASKVAELEAKIAALQAELAKEKGAAEVAMAEKKKLEEEKVCAEKKAAFNLLLSEGKVVKAQEEAFLKNDTVKFAELAQPINLKGSGHVHEIQDADSAAIIKLAEEKQKADPKLDRGTAISLAKKQLKK